MDAVISERRGEVAVFMLNNPPVNGFSVAQRKALSDEVDAALADDGVAAIVITGGGRLFSGGADIREFQTPAALTEPNMRQIIAKIEASPKPIIAAIHSAAMGGGLEISLACHYRIAAPGTRLALPEVKLGIVPGAGGTQRLPRLIGVRAALDMIVSGDPATDPLGLGLVDAIAEEDLVDEAVAFAREGRAPRRTSELVDYIADAKGHPEIFDDFRKSIARRARGFDAPYACIDAVQAAVEMPFEDGLAREREIFERCLEAPQSKAQRHVFFAEREVAKIVDVPADTPTKSIASAAVIGCGTMGGGIAMNFANAGIPVTVVETSAEGLKNGLRVIERNYAATVKRSRLGQDDMDRRMDLITGSTEFETVAPADIVVEAVFEEMGIKKEVFAKLDRLCKADAILATNTSTLDVDEIAASTSRPESVIGTHFFSPANVMRLMENVRGAKSSPETIATVMKLSKILGKIGVLVGVCDGFVGNRMLAAYTRQANFLLEEGALPHQIDKVMYEFGLPMGPFAMGDLVGLDVSWRIRKGRGRQQGVRYSPIADRICELGRFGQKTGSGWYRYDGNDRTPIPDPEIEALITSTSDELGIERRAIGDDEILERCLYPLINEGAKILDEGLAQRPLDIDIIWIHGYGFPRYLGGPMFHADAVGLDKILGTMTKLHDTHGEELVPAPLLARLVRDGKSFADL
jgi:3-hydroxyacyl-CoA dehydrogenase